MLFALYRQQNEIGNDAEKAGTTDDQVEGITDQESVMTLMAGFEGERDDESPIEEQELHIIDKKIRFSCFEWQQLGT